MDLNKIADIYQSAPMIVPSTETKNAYSALKKELKNQFKNIPVNVSFTEIDLYASAEELFHDIEMNRQMKIFTGFDVPKEHYLSEKFFLNISYNHILRACHDYYGHYLPRTGFDSEGEVKAYLLQSSQMALECRPALATELLGQTAWCIFTVLQKPYFLLKNVSLWI